MNLAESIARLRREQGMTQEALAELIGVSPQTVSKWETSTTAPDVTLLPLLAEEDFRRAMQLILEKRMLTFTVSSLMKQCGALDAANLERCLQASRLFSRKELVVDETPLSFYELVWGEAQLFLLYAVLAFAREYVDYQSMHYIFVGNMKYFTP